MVQLVKDYARQETLGPLKGAGRWIALGLVGALLIGTATGFLVLGTLRLVQTEWPGTFQGRWAQLAPYAFALGGLPVVHKARLVTDLPPLVAQALAAVPASRPPGAAPA